MSCETTPLFYRSFRCVSRKIVLGKGDECKIKVFARLSAGDHLSCHEIYFDRDRCTSRRPNSEAGGVNPRVLSPLRLLHVAGLYSALITPSQNASS